MKIIHRDIIVPERNGEVEIYPLGDLHIGYRACCEKLLKKTVSEIASKRNAYWIGGGDYLDAIKPSDAKRFDMDTLPDWMLEGEAETIRKRLNDVLTQQKERCKDILLPIKNKCLGLIEGNHEFSIRKYHNENVHNELCNKLETEDLTDEALIRINFKHKIKGKSSTNTISRVVILYICHGHGGGRTAGAEPNHLSRMLLEWEIADICFRGHSHTFQILPPKPVLEIPKSGQIPDECTCRYRWAANWGCWTLQHAVGPSTYASRACYPARPMLTCKAVIKPFYRKHTGNKEYQTPLTEIRSITL